MPPAAQTSSKNPLGTAPERSLTQRMDALKRANEIRTQRARLKRDLKAGRTQIHGLLLDPPEWLATAKVFDLLLAVPKYGRVKVNRILTQCRISPSKTIGGLSERQRNELVSYPAPLSGPCRTIRKSSSSPVRPGSARERSSTRLLERHPAEFALSISATTRDPRPGEQQGRDYYFLDRAEFDAQVADGDFLEHAEYAGNRYGTPRAELDRMVKALVLEIEIQGALQIRQTLPEALQVFILPPSFETLRERLVGRGTDKPEVIERRLARAREELDEAEREAAHFGNRIVNDDLEASVRELEALVAKVWGRDFEGATE